MTFEDILTNLPHYEETLSLWYGRATFVITGAFAVATQVLNRLEAAAKETPFEEDDKALAGAHKWLDVAVRAFRAFSQYKG